MSEVYTNGPQTTLNGAIGSGDATLIVTSASGFPAVNFRLIVKAEGSNKDEIMLVTLVSSTTFTITRAYEAIADGTQVAQSHANGAIVAHVLTAGGLQDGGVRPGARAAALVTANQMFK